MENQSEITREQYIKFEQYHFNLVMFTTTKEFRELNDEWRNKLLVEIEYIAIVISVLSKVFISDHGRLRRVMAWTVRENDIGYNVLFEFSCIESASLILDIQEHLIVLLCEGKSKYNNIKGYNFTYKENFDNTIKHTDF